MAWTRLIFILLSAFISSSYSFTTSERQINFLNYEDARIAIMDTEDRLSTGGTIILSAKEQLVNRIFMKHKLAELSKGFNDTDKHAPGMHFFKAKKLIDNSKVFQFLKQMPKGALLHGHNSALVSSEWVIRNLTYMPGLWSCVDHKGDTLLTFRRSSEVHKCSTPYSSVSLERKKALSKRHYDKQLERKINLYTPVPEMEYSSLNKVWKKFQSVFGTTWDLLNYIPAFRFYHWRLLEEAYQDGIMYLELRMEFKRLYDDCGNEYPPEFAADELKAIVHRFRAIKPDFLGVKVIYSASRKLELAGVSDKMEIFKKFHEESPNFVIGFDLVGQEDLGNSLYNLVDELKNLPETAKYFFHAGETNWYGASTDYNLLDAILLNSTRIGHGYALSKHPVLWNAVKKRGIALEVSPISNQVLNLVWDLRNHPGAFFISENIPIVITSDDPGFWNAKGLSYDFYYAIMSFAPTLSGLKTLKQLVWNSIKYSVLNDLERKEAYTIMEKKWEHFLDIIISSNV